MATYVRDLDCLVTRLEKLERLNRWARCAGAVMLSLVGALLLSGGQGRANSKIPDLAGCVVVQKSASGDDTAVIQAAIDSLGGSGGVVFFPAGVYKHTGLKGKANVHLKGVHASAVILDYTPHSGEGITFVDDPDFFAISDLTLSSSGRSKGWALRADKGVHRYIRVHRVNINGFLNGLYIANAINCTIDQCHLGQTYPNSPSGIGIQLGDGKETGGNAVTIQDCFFSSLEKGVVTYAQAALILRPIIELCNIGVETHGTTTVLHPWVDATTAKIAHISIQANTVGGGRSGTGALLLGYGSGAWKVKYGTDTERQRTIVIPERLDFDPGDDPKDRRGIKLGSVVIDKDGIVHLKDLKRTP